MTTTHDPLMPDSPEMVALDKALEIERPINEAILIFLQDAAAKGQTTVTLPEELRRRAEAANKGVREAYDVLMAAIDRYDAHE